MFNLVCLSLKAYFNFYPLEQSLIWGQYDIKYSDTQQNDTQHNDIQHSYTWHKHTQRSNENETLSITSC